MSDHIDSDTTDEEIRATVERDKLRYADGGLQQQIQQKPVAAPVDQQEDPLAAIAKRMGDAGYCNYDACLEYLQEAYFAGRAALASSPQLADWRKMCILEIAVENQSVSDYIEHWEGRALKAENKFAFEAASSPESSQPTTDADGVEFANWATRHYGSMDYRGDSTEEVAVKFAKAHSFELLGALKKVAESGHFTWCNMSTGYHHKGCNCGNAEAESAIARAEEQG